MITDWNRIDALVDKLTPEMIAVRSHLHAHPEPSGAECQTAQFLAERLRADGLEVRRVADDRGLLVAPPRARMGSRLGLRADTDALLIHEERPSPYQSQVPGVMHACGHYAHSGIQFGTLIALWQATNQAISISICQTPNGTRRRSGCPARRCPLRQNITPSSS